MGAPFRRSIVPASPVRFARWYHSPTAQVADGDVAKFDVETGTLQWRTDICDYPCTFVAVAAAPALPHLAVDWLHAKAVTAGTTTGNSDRARHQDLARWGRILRQLAGHDVDETAQFDVEADLAGLTPRSLSVEHLVAALDVLRRRYKSATLSRSISTLRSFCRWLVNRGHLTSNPFDDEILHVRHRTQPEIRAFSPEDIDLMIGAAASPPPEAISSWATRDAAAIDVLAFTGVRAAEFCALQVGDVGTTDRSILHIRRGAKGNKRREVPLPLDASERIDTYLSERAEAGIRVGPRTELFVRNDGRAMSTDSLYHLVKRIALAAGASLPDDALVHGLRHHFGVQLAIRGVSPATLQQLMGHTDPRTTALYTRHASRDLVNALDDAGWLARR